MEIYLVNERDRIEPSFARAQHTRHVSRGIQPIEKRHDKTLKALIIHLGFENFREFLTNQLNYRTFFGSKTCYSPSMINFKEENFKRRKLELVSHLCTDE